MWPAAEPEVVVAERRAVPAAIATLSAAAAAAVATPSAPHTPSETWDVWTTEPEPEWQVSPAGQGAVPAPPTGPTAAGAGAGARTDADLGRAVPQQPSSSEPPATAGDVEAEATVHADEAGSPPNNDAATAIALSALQSVMPSPTGKARRATGANGKRGRGKRRTTDTPPASGAGSTAATPDNSSSGYDSQPTRPRSNGRKRPAVAQAQPA